MADVAVGIIGAKQTLWDCRVDRARGRDVSVSAGPRSRRCQMNIFKVDRARVSFSAVNAAGRLHRTFQPTERDVPNRNGVGSVSFRATPPPKPHVAGRPVSVAFQGRAVAAALALLPWPTVIGSLRTAAHPSL